MSSLFRKCPVPYLIRNGPFLSNLTVNDEYPSSELVVTLPRPGQHSYTAEANAIFDVQGTRLQYAGAGQGVIAPGWPPTAQILRVEE